MSDGVEVPATGMDRRDFIKSSVVAGGLVWAAPAMSSLGSHAFATGTPLNICPTEDMPSGLRWEYTGRGCGGNGAPPALDFCEDREGYPEAASNGTLKVTITGGPDRGTYTTGTPGRNETAFKLDGGGQLERGKTFSSPPNGGKAGAQTLFEVYRDGTLVHRVRVHTSCSRDLSIGEEFGSFKLIAGIPGG